MKKLRNNRWIAALLALLAFLPARSAAAEAETVSLPVVMYHDISRDTAQWGPYVVSEAELESDLRWLREHGYETVSVQASRARRLGRYHMMTAQNPVSIITLQGGKKHA